ncbi:hypothetical protein [Burkholderia ubonensis]|uniref:hypothetical protein n=1 Tax=Burkholderia ubonensis TaxID=101571 RepID=UPI002AB1D315|nr:hypothetical protein [Burkholderia ubonensis]
MSELDRIKTAARSAGCPEGADVAEWLRTDVLPAMLQPSRERLGEIYSTGVDALMLIAELSKEDKVRATASTALDRMTAELRDVLSSREEPFTTVISGEQDMSLLQMYMDENSPTPAELAMFAPGRLMFIAGGQPRSTRAPQELRDLIVKVAGVDPTAPQLDVLGRALRAVRGSLYAFYVGVTTCDATLFGLTADELASIEPITNRIFKRRAGAAGKVQ